MYFPEIFDVQYTDQLKLLIILQQYNLIFIMITQFAQPI